MLLLFLISCEKKNSIQNTDLSTLTSNPFLERAKQFNKENQKDSAFYYFNLAKNSFLENNDSLGVGRALVNMAIIQSDRGDYFGSIETSIEAKKFIKYKKDSNVLRTLASNYNNLGVASNYLKNHNESYNYYLKAIDNAVDKNIYVYYNNIGDNLITQKRFNEAKRYLEKANITKDSNTLSKAINNLAKVKYLSDAKYNPLPELYQALEIRKKTNDGPGQNSSFETLSTYYLERDKSLSLNFAKMMLDAAINNKSLDDQILALQRIISLERKNYLKNFQNLNSINDTLQTKRNRDKNQFATIRYDVEQKNAQNQLLEKQSLKQIVGIAALVIALISVFVWNEKRKKHIRQEKEKEKELEVKNTELRYSKKVHDVVANGLYHMMIDIDNNPNINKMKILNDMEKMYEESRDISHEKSADIDFYERFGKMINSYSSLEQKVISTKYAENVWEKVSQNSQSEIFYVIREILVNMKKHSGAKLVVLKFEKDEDALHITYTDNGKGIKNLTTQKGAGIRNTENRIDAIEGDIIFEENPTGGLIIKITIPIQKYV